MVWTSRFPARSSDLTSLVIRFLSIGSRPCPTLPPDPASRQRPPPSRGQALALRESFAPSIWIEDLHLRAVRPCSAHWVAGTSPATGSQVMSSAPQKPTSLNRTALAQGRPRRNWGRDATCGEGSQGDVLKGLDMRPSPDH